MRRNNKILWSIGVLVLAGLACSTVMGGIPETGSVILSDDFSSSGWGTGTDTDSAIEYVNNALQMQLFTKNWFVWSTPNNQQYENVHIEVTVINNETDSTTAFGIICNKETGRSNFNYVAMTPAGEYVIARAAVGQSDFFLTNDDKWGPSNSIPKNADSYRVGADCGSDGTLTLYVNGQQIDSVSDTTHTSGGVALFTWSGEDVSSADVSFDDFLMMSLP